MSRVYGVSYSLGPFDYLGSLDRLGGDADLLRDVAELFEIDSVDLLNRLRTAAELGDRKGMAIAAHSLFGLASTFGATRVTSAAARIESSARDHSVPMPSDLSELKSAVEELIFALRRLPDDA
jgi:HPt (histidine-containing phosphotransfer) domain-containing protein